MPTSPPTDRPNTIHWPPLLYALTLAAAAALHLVWPLPAAAWPAGTLAGWPLVALGIGVALAALYRFRTDGTSFDPPASIQLGPPAPLHRWVFIAYRAIRCT
jgi:hypothetical protein